MVFRIGPNRLLHPVPYRQKIDSVQLSFLENGLNRTEPVGSIWYRPEPSDTGRFSLVRYGIGSVRLDLIFFWAVGWDFFLNFLLLDRSSTVPYRLATDMDSGIESANFGVKQLSFYLLERISLHSQSHISAYVPRS